MNQLRFGNLVGAALLLLALAACTKAPVKVESLDDRLAAKGFAQGEVVDSAPDFKISNWNYLDPQHLMVETADGRGFLISTLYICAGLPATNQISFTTDGGTLTPSNDLLIVYQAAQQRCSIGEIRLLERIAPPPATVGAKAAG